MSDPRGGARPAEAGPGGGALSVRNAHDLMALQQRVSHPVLADVLSVLGDRVRSEPVPVAYYEDGPGLVL
ncbi:hypothetical protein HEK616_57730 [Streptomyces nigrescens]|uniref:Uncharacterized protein n=2 Tax=Streptomyces TaxID=1883 RepID=A0ABM8A0Y1_STRNI|nr:YxD-tail cyclophane-containing RiPP peptide [Streptomyces nigrescens]MEE4424095.1 YxD-tail cyclophane-containing RiPP peptide [Streptomyces sp. DSM 41528]BDM72286.1 hypothetical protein HEK616_57730 [Streptomyces nigrescens]